MGVMITLRGSWQSPRLLSSFPRVSTLLNTLSTLFKKKIGAVQTSVHLQVIKQNVHKEVLFGLQKE